MINDRQRALLRDLSELGGVLSEYDSLDQVRQAVSENQQRLESLRGALCAVQASLVQEIGLRDSARAQALTIKEEIKKAEQELESFMQRAQEDRLRVQQEMKKAKREHEAEMKNAQDALVSVNQQVEQANSLLVTLHQQIEERRGVLARLLES
jgi:DNA repair exonuclease SbcCD ATPase subunit